ncbi:MAG: type II/IV secretion system protein, partial [Saezia sp.]
MDSQETSTQPAEKATKKKRISYSGELKWQDILKWLVEDGRLSKENAKIVFERLSDARSEQHPLLRLALLKIEDTDGKVLDADVLSEWLAGYIGMQFLRIDPMKADAGKVGDIMSIEYAQRYSILPIKVSNHEILTATAQPFITSWIREIEHITRKQIRLVFSNPADISRYSIEFFNLAKSIRNVVSKGGAAAAVSLEQLVDLGKTGRQLDANDQGIIQLVDWLWQYAFDQRASDIHLEPRRDTGFVRFRIDGVLHTVYQFPMP